MANEIKKFLNAEGVGILWREIGVEIADAVAAEKAERVIAEGALAESVASAKTELYEKIGDIDTTVKAYVDEKTKGVVTDTALANLQDDVDALEVRVENIEKDYLTSEDKTELSDAIAAEASRADTAEKLNAAAIKAIADDYVKAADIANFETKENVQKVADDLANYKTSNDEALAAEIDRATKAEAKALEDAKTYADGIKSDLLGDDLTSTFDTLKAVQEWADEHDGTAEELLTSINTEKADREAADTALSNRIKAYEDAKDTYATVSALNEVRELADAAQTAKEVSDAIDAKITALDLANTYETKQNVADLNSAMDARVAKLEANEAGYATTGEVAVAKQEAINEAYALIKALEESDILAAIGRPTTTE
jgi:chromosome segregation ATPase